MKDRIRVLLVDDQDLFREALAILMSIDKRVEIVGSVSGGENALQFLLKDQPDVVLMDIRMPGMDGVEATRRLCARWPDARVIILTTFDDDANVFEGLRAGAVGYLLKDLSGQELANAVRTVYKGGALIEPTVAKRVMAEFARLHPPARSIDNGLPEPLSERELEILKLISNGLSNREIGNKLGLSEGTVKNYVTNVLQKIGVRDRTQAALRGRELGLI